jgi:hypothetical protein
MRQILCTTGSEIFFLVYPLSDFFSCVRPLRATACSRDVAPMQSPSLHLLRRWRPATLPASQSCRSISEGAWNLDGCGVGTAILSGFCSPGLVLYPSRDSVQALVPCTVSLETRLTQYSFLASYPGLVLHSMYKTGMERAKGHFSPNGSFARVACRVFAFIFFFIF